MEKFIVDVDRAVYHSTTVDEEAMRFHFDVPMLPDRKKKELYKNAELRVANEGFDEDNIRWDLTMLILALPYCARAILDMMLFDKRGVASIANLSPCIPKDEFIILMNKVPREVRRFLIL